MTMDDQTPPTSSWPSDELRAIAEADDLHVAPYREDGETTGTPTWIWNVAVEGDLYVRAYNGTDSSWYQAAVLEPVDGPINDRIDEAYRTKYAGSPYLAPMVSERARFATVKITPRETE
jgi:hypothetical protein